MYVYRYVYIYIYIKISLRDQWNIVEYLTTWLHISSICNKYEQLIVPGLMNKKIMEDPPSPVALVPRQHIIDECHQQQ